MTLLNEKREPSVGITAHYDASELELVKLGENFLALNDQLDCLMRAEEPSDPLLLVLHRQWEDACAMAATLSASTKEGQRAKARMLLAALDVIVPRTNERELHEGLAASLARDLIT